MCNGSVMAIEPTQTARQVGSVSLGNKEEKTTYLENEEKCERSRKSS